MSKKAYSLLEGVEFDDEKRIITGIASTPAPDRYDDIMDMADVKFALPMPFLWQHSHSQPIGHVTKANVTPSGIEVEIQIAKIEEDGNLKNRIDDAWQAIKSGLVKGLSIGFRGLEVEENPNSKKWGLWFKSWEWYELSAVTIPANAECSITSIKHYAKSFDDESAATGNRMHFKAQATPSVGDATTTMQHSVKLISPQQTGGVKIHV